MLGGSLMSLALFLKNKIFLLKKFLSKLLKYELLYSFFVLSTIPIIYFSLSIEYFGYLFLINSIFGLIIFSTLHKRTVLK